MNLNQVTLDTTDVARSLAFYRALGLQLIVDNAPRYVRLACPDGGSTLSLHHAGQVTTGGITLYFESDRLDEWVAELRTRGFAFDSDPVDQPWRWREAHLRDPEGHRLILYHAGRNRRDPPWRVK